MWDEFDLYGDYDFRFRLPPVPFDGEWQIRLGFTAQDTRGVAQIYVDDVPQGIPLDMTWDLSTDYYIGDDYITSISTYDGMSDEDKAEYQKELKNLGVYAYPRTVFRNDGNSGNIGWDCVSKICIRRVISQTYLDSTIDHYMRIRVASDGSQGNKNEFALDFLELVPKSVYGTDGEGNMEDDL
jgi:hypothetical protein